MLNEDEGLQTMQAIHINTSDYKVTLFNPFGFTDLFFGIKKNKKSRLTKHWSVHLKHE